PAEASDFGAQLHLAPIEGWDVYLNAVTGQNSGTIFDVTTGYQVTDELYVGVNAAKYWSNDDLTTITETENSYLDLNSDAAGYQGGALYVNYALTDALSLGLRGEMFTFVNNAGALGGDAVGSNLSGEDITMSAITASANYTVGGLTLIPEVRYDVAEKIGKGAGAQAEDRSSVFGSDNNSIRLGLAAVYAF
ncbi:MAG: outer membrane beta-barrel protein, partial [Cyclobacteriaceae bacterium]